jgi:hypothetical protein
MNNRADTGQFELENLIDQVQKAVPSETEPEVTHFGSDRPDSQLASQLHRF